MKLAAAMLGALLLSAAAGAEEFGWRDKDGKPVADTESRKSSNGFAAQLLTTSDQDWHEKWDTPESDTPQFSLADSVSKGEQIVTIIFIVNPMPGPDGAVNVVCDVRVVRPDGSESISAKDQPCLRGKLSGNPYNIRLSPVALPFIGEEGDPLGKWTVDITLRDKVRNVALDLHTSFEYLGDARKK